MHRRILLMVAALVLTAVCAGAANQDEIMFTLQRGRAALSRTNGVNWLDLGPQPVVVKFQDKLRTEGETRGELKYPDGSVFRVKSNSVLTVLDGGMQLQVGETWFNLQKQGRQFQVVTPTAVCGVLGTTFDVNVDRYGKTQVRVFDGMVTVKANGDQRKRQQVLQRGMMTQVKDRSVTEDRIQKFDAKAEEKRVSEEWKNSGAAPVRFGPPRPGLAPSRQELPPMRPALPGGEGLERPGKSRFGQDESTRDEPEGDEPPEGSEIRDRMQFFDRLRSGRRPDEKRRSETDPAGSFNRAPLPGQFAGGFDRPALNSEQQREGLARPFGQTGPGPLGAADQRQIRDELMQVQNEMTRVREEISTQEQQLQQILAQASAQRSQTGVASVSITNTRPAGVSLSPESQVRVRSLQQRLIQLRERLRWLLQRLENLRNRLH